MNHFNRSMNPFALAVMVGGFVFGAPSSARAYEFIRQPVPTGEGKPVERKPYEEILRCREPVVLTKRDSIFENDEINWRSDRAEKPGRYTPRMPSKTSL